MSCVIRPGFLSGPPSLRRHPSVCRRTVVLLRSAGPPPFGVSVRFFSRLPAPFRHAALRGIPVSCSEKKELLLLRVRPGQVKARLRSFGGIGPSAALVLWRLRLFGGCGPAVIALRSAPCIFFFGRGRSVTAGRECRMLSRERGCVRPHDRFCAAGAKKRSDASRRRASLVRLVRLMRVGEPHVCYTKINRFLGKTKYFVTFLRVDESFSDRL